MAEVHALSNISFVVERGEFIAIMGPSGSGKSTLMHILGCLDRPTSGSYYLDNSDVTALSNKELSIIRNHRIGFVFQSYNLIFQLNVIENVEVPLIYNRMSLNYDSGMDKCLKAIRAVGLNERLRHRPSELSGGEMQRVAIARALVNDPLIILADEPTGNLDSKTGEEIMGILKGLNDEGRTVIVVTHDEKVASHANRTIKLKDGSILVDSRQ
ncbi:MAG TPA: ABC transporter ATP-binding protein [Candidatus Brocadiia bacterium]|nr:ABC transporter ATP-binding protein [Planctomycetota bacterium]MDO8093216.1 ABC transporter ATP-binding protein [Candidatus Brocadiales bacterium]